MDNVKKNKIIFFRNKIRKWYVKSGRDFPWRKKSRTNYEIVISEVLLQRTRAETIFGYYFKFLKKYPSWKVLSQATEKSLRIILEPIGLWRQRAKSLFSLSRSIHKHGGKLPSTRKELEILPGVGQYIASAILLICYGKREPLLDVNMARLLERFFGPRKLSDIRYDPYLQKLSRDILPTKNIKEFNWAILDFSSLICKKRNPNCSKCPLKNNCSFINQEEVIMPYNVKIEMRINKSVSRWKDTAVKKMFGGVCHLLKGNMFCGVYKDFLILRLGEEEASKALLLRNVKPFDITGKPMKGWIMVEQKGFETDDILKEWLTKAKKYVKTLPAK